MVITLKPKPKIIRKRQIHNDRMAEAFKAGCIVVGDKVILLILVIFLILECETHTEDSLRSIRITLICHIDVLIRDLLVIFRNEVQLICSRLDCIADGIRLDEVHGCDQIRDLLNHADQRNLRRSCLHMAALHLNIKNWHQHLLRRRSAVHKVLAATGYFEHVAADRIRYDLCIIISKDPGHRHKLNTFIYNRILSNDKAPINKCTLTTYAADLIAFRNLVLLINESVISCYNKMMCIGIGIDLAD